MKPEGAQVGWRPCACAALAATWLVAAGGCRFVSRHQVSAETALAPFAAAHLEYKVDAGRLNVPLELTRVESQLVSYDHLATTPLPDQAVGTLTIQYPHPDGHTGFAQARLEIRNADEPPAPPLSAAWRLFSRNTPPAAVATSNAALEVWELDIPRLELDQVVAELNRQGYFSPAAAGSEGVEITAQLSGSKLEKRWKQVAQLDALMLRARGDGRLVSYQRPRAAPSSQPSAVLAYRDWQGTAPAPGMQPGAILVADARRPAAGVSLPSGAFNQSPSAAVPAASASSPGGWRR